MITKEKFIQDMKSILNNLDCSETNGYISAESHWCAESEGSELWSPSFDSVTFDRPAPVITPHPHAALMMKYAEVAARRSDPWVEFEHCCDDIEEDYWIQCDAFIGFHSDYFYRHISYRHIGDNK